MRSNISSLSKYLLSKPTVTNVSTTRRISSKIYGGKYMKAEIVRKKGKSVLADPLFNKGLGHPRSERDRLSIRGLLPSQVHLVSMNVNKHLR